MSNVIMSLDQAIDQAKILVKSKAVPEMWRDEASMAMALQMSQTVGVPIFSFTHMCKIDQRGALIMPTNFKLNIISERCGLTNFRFEYREVMGKMKVKPFTWDKGSRSFGQEKEVSNLSCRATVVQKNEVIFGPWIDLFDLYAEGQHIKNSYYITRADQMLQFTAKRALIESYFGGTAALFLPASEDEANDSYLIDHEEIKEEIKEEVKIDLDLKPKNTFKKKDVKAEEVKQTNAWGDID
jgi:hypothetical protein